MAGVFRQRANYRRSRRRLHAALQWQFDAPTSSVPPASVRRRKRTEFRQPPRWNYERHAAARRRAFVPLNVETPFGHFAMEIGGLIPSDFRGHWV